ncbi:MAG: glycosyltransferase family 87 protein [Phenylobacterium sp.]
MTEAAAPAAPPTSLVFDRKVLAIQVVFAAVLAIGLGLQAVKVVPDFSAFWAAHHVARPYDAAILSQAANAKTFFPYAPTFLVMTFPLAWVSMTVGYLAWVGLSAAGLVASMRRLSAPLTLAVPAVFMGVVAGQTCLVMGALLFAGATLRKRPALAGALLGVAACIKPQVVVLLPFVLLAGREWRMIAGAVGAGLLLCLAATLAYGPGIWADWLSSLPGFLKANDATWAGRYLALPGLWKIAALAAGAAAAAWAGWRGQLERGVFVAVAAALLGSLHAMDYDAAILAPFAVSAALANRWLALPYVVALAFPPSPWTVLALAALTTWSILAGGWRFNLAPQAGSKQKGNMI